MSISSANQTFPNFSILKSGFCGYHKDLATASLHNMALQEKTMETMRLLHGKRFTSP